MAARCEELYGNGTLQQWVETIRDPRRIVSMLQQNFVLGPHKVEHLDRVLRHCRVFLYSDAPPAIVELLGLELVDDLQRQAEELFSDRTKSYAFMPFAAITFPQVR
jgi:nickel-dependent lactate racemase